MVFSVYTRGVGRCCRAVGYLVFLLGWRPLHIAWPPKGGEAGRMLDMPSVAAVKTFCFLCFGRGYSISHPNLLFCRRNPHRYFVLMFVFAPEPTLGPTPRHLHLALTFRAGTYTSAHAKRFVFGVLRSTPKSPDAPVCYEFRAS